mmetsp:Transcript_60709/g.185426  ORF Transcript_60709/g.185426 Transcript_60709/m.185426 type:complete len:318 (+) Transcript_60709:326-1279(+)
MDHRGRGVRRRKGRLGLAGDVGVAHGLDLVNTVLIGEVVEHPENLVDEHEHLLGLARARQLGEAAEVGLRDGGALELVVSVGHANGHGQDLAHHKRRHEGLEKLIDPLLRPPHRQPLAKLHAVTQLQDREHDHTIEGDYPEHQGKEQTPNDDVRMAEAVDESNQQQNKAWKEEHLRETEGVKEKQRNRDRERRQQHDIPLDAAHVDEGRVARAPTVGMARQQSQLAVRRVDQSGDDACGQQHVGLDEPSRARLSPYDQAREEHERDRGRPASDVRRQRGQVANHRAAVGQSLHGHEIRELDKGECGDEGHVPRDLRR